jgi:outer membrane protein with glycine zipper
MKMKNMVVAAALSFAMTPAFGGDSAAKSAVGGGIGGAGGAAIGEHVGGKTGAIVGGAAGGAVGAAATTGSQGKKGAILGGAVGGGAGAAIGDQVGGDKGAIIGAGIGGAAGSAIGREMNRGSKPKTAAPQAPATQAGSVSTAVSQSQQTTTPVAKPQAVSVAHDEHHQCKPKHNKGKGWAKGHDKHC